MIYRMTSLETTPGSKLTLHCDPHFFRLILQQALAGKYHFHLACTDTKGNRSKCTMSGSMAVSTDNGLSGLGDPEFRTNNMYNAMILVGQME